jgi:hypothetical protein
MTGIRVENTGQIGRIPLILQGDFLVVRSEKNVPETFLGTEGMEIEISIADVKGTDFLQKTKACKETQQHFLLVLALPVSQRQPVQDIEIDRC